MHTLLVAVLTLVLVNTSIFLIHKLTDFVTPYLYKYLRKKEYIQTSRQIKETRIRNKHAYWFWSFWTLFCIAADPLHGVNFAIAWIAGLGLYIAGEMKGNDLAHVE